MLSVQDFFFQIITRYFHLLARLFSKKASRYCHSPGIVGVVVRHCAKTLTFSNISVITEDIYLKLRIVVHYQKGNPYQ